MIALAIALASPGRYSIDTALGIHVPAIVSGVCAALAAVTLGVALARRSKPGAARGQQTRAA